MKSRFPAFHSPPSISLKFTGRQTNADQTVAGAAHSPAAHTVFAKAARCC